jgi:uncharacterized protein YdaL
VEQNLNTIMLDISTQFKRAVDMNILEDVAETNTHIVATFYDKTRNFIIDAVVVHLTKRYGEYVYVMRNSNNPKVVEIWHKEMLS